METTLVKESLLVPNYLSLSEFLSFVEKNDTFPYKTNFSFNPYIKLLSSMRNEACGKTQSALLPIVQANQEMMDNGVVSLEEMMKHPQFKTMISLVVPSMLFDNERSFISPPFRKNFIVRTSAFNELFESDDWQLQVDPTRILKVKSNKIRQAGIEILNRHYGQTIDNSIADIVTLRNKQTGIEKHFQINLRFDFIDVIHKGPLPDISDSDINLLLNSSSEELWLKFLPKETFEFEGFAVGNMYDVTKLQVLANLKKWISDGAKTDMTPTEFVNGLQSHMRSFLNSTDLEGGFLPVDLKYRSVFIDRPYSLTGKTFFEELSTAEESDQKSLYHEAHESKKAVFVENLEDHDNFSKAEKKLYKKGFKSILLLPILSENGDVFSILEFCSKQANVFNALTVEGLEEVFEELIEGNQKYIHELDNQIAAIIQQNFTAVHPSVEWKFEQVARNFFEHQYYKRDVNIEPIVFSNIHPLYGQSDIINSSNIRNNSILIDLVENIELLQNVIAGFLTVRPFELLKAYNTRLDKILTRLKKKFVSTDESSIVHLITTEINPLLQKLKERHNELDTKEFRDYFDALDPRLGIIYNRRKQFEDSVTKLNFAVSDFIEKEDGLMQKQLPHYFEKYKTDGVEYNLYVGQSLLEAGEYHDTDLKNFRLWQLVNMCGVVRLVNDLKPTLEIPLETAQLIFVYNNALSIRFRMDEKKFDVDGAYNVRYEILKKRIDKALIKGTKDRLTAAGKIAVVYLTAQDKAEYMEYFSYLISENIIEDNIEDLELAKLQGAEGLRALRVTVILNAG